MQFISPVAGSRPHSSGMGESYSVELWFWNGLPTGVRPITGHLLSFDNQQSDVVYPAAILASAERVSTRAGFSFQPVVSHAKEIVGKTEDRHPRPGIISLSCTIAVKSSSISTARPSPRFSVRSRSTPENRLESLIMSAVARTALRASKGRSTRLPFSIECSVRMTSPDITPQAVWPREPRERPMNDR